MDILLPVSLGEAIDKLTILDIKCEMITDSRKDDCKKEYDILMDKLKDFVDNNKYYYDILKYINLQIWKDQDIIRNLTNNEEIGKLSTKVLNDNDARFRIKKVINDLTNSSIKEQKGYNKKSAILITHHGMGDLINLNGAIRYLSILYDELILFVPNTPSYYTSNTIEMYKDIKNIEFFLCEKKLYTNYSKEMIENLVKKKVNKVYKTGYHLNYTFPCEIVPLSFYDQLNIDRKAMNVFFKLPVLLESQVLYNKVKDKEFIFCHLTGSQKENSYPIEKINIDKKYLIIDINTNRYPPDHEYYELAQSLIKQPMLHYMDIMKNAKEMYLINSSFYCLAGLLCKDIDQKRVCYCNANMSYINDYHAKFEFEKLTE